MIIPDADLQDKRHRYYFLETIKLDKNQTYVSPIDLNIEHGKIETPYIPVVRLATPLFNSNSEKVGILILNLYFSGCLQLLPENMFLQTEEGNLISLNPDGTVNFYQSNYVFSESSGSLSISDVVTIHYAAFESLSGKTVIVAVRHEHSSLKVELQRLVLRAIILFTIFLCLISVVGFINISRSRDLIGAQKAIISSLAGLAEFRDPETGAHLERTRQYSVTLAKQLGKNEKYRRVITNDFIENLYDAAPLHDIGKTGIRDSILFKESKLTNEEYEEMKKHVSMGAQIIQKAIDEFKLKQPFILISRNICAYHHEKYNGNGYQERLKGEEIPLEARIFALCDAYDAIRTKRPYKNKLPHEEAIKRIKLDSGEHFDPDIVDAFLKCEKEIAAIGETFEY